MPALGLPTGTEERSYGGLPKLPIVNLVSEKAITEPSQIVLQSRPRLQRYLSSALGAATAIRALFYTETASLGTFFAVYGSTFRQQSGGTTATLTDGGVVPSIAGNEIGVVATMGAGAKWWNGSAFKSISFPDSANVTKVLQSQGRFIFIRADSERYYVTEPLSNMINGSGDMVIDGAAYVSAENDADLLVDGVIWQDRIVLGGTSTVEIHGPSGDDNAPWQPLLGSTIHKGDFRTGCMDAYDNTFVWLSPDRVIWRYNGSSQPDRISNAGIEEALKFADSPRLDSFFLEGREFLHVWNEDGGFTILNGDLLLDASSVDWCEWETYGWPLDAGPAISIGESYPLFGAKTDSRILGMRSRSTLPGGSWETAVEHRFTAGMAIDGGSVAFANLLLRCQTYNGAGSQTVSMRYSRGKGSTWSAWKDRSLVGSSIRNKIEWRQLGLMDNPGFLAQFRTANCTEFSVSGAYYNEFVQGRSR